MAVGKISVGDSFVSFVLFLSDQHPLHFLTIPQFPSEEGSLPVGFSLLGL